MELTTALDFSHSIHRGIHGEHPDCDDFRSATRRERPLVVTVRPEHPSGVLPRR